MRKFQQIKTFSKIIKSKKETGEVEELNPSNSRNIHPQYNTQHIGESMEEERNKVEDHEFEDQFEDEYEEEEGWVSQQEGEGDEDGTIQSEEDGMKKINASKKQKADVFIGTKKNLKKGEVLEFDNNAYDMLHRLNNQWPSLSIDFLYRDSPFSPIPSPVQIKKYPLEVYTVQGSSSDTQSNQIYLTKWTKLHKTKYDDDPDVEGDQQDEQLGNDQDPQVIVQHVSTTYNVNRVRALEGSPIVGFWNDQGEVHIMDLTKNYQKLRNGIGNKKKEFAQQIVLHSESEGFGLAWNPHKIGQLITGNILGQVEIFENNQNYTSWTKSSTYTYHKGSIQDIVLSPNEPSVFATCSSDGTLQIVDMRVGDYKKSQLLVKAHEKDVNVCDWSRAAPNLIVSGSDDCSVKVWDLRKLKEKKGKGEELLSFNWHTEPITSIKFQPNEESVIAVSSQDNSVSIWDMAVENQEEDPEVPNELMFIHQGQQEIKEIAFHPIYYEMMISSAADGINLWKPSYEMPEQQGDMKEDLKRPAIIEEELDEYIEKMNKKQ